MTIADNGGSKEVRRKRLLFRAQRRGFKEVDLIFGAFAAEALPTMENAALDEFEALLAAPDKDVFAWLQDQTPVPPEYDNATYAGLKAVCRRKNPTWSV
jgi:antitoxin CptB